MGGLTPILRTCVWRSLEPGACQTDNLDIRPALMMGIAERAWNQSWTQSAAATCCGLIRSCVNDVRCGHITRLPSVTESPRVFWTSPGSTLRQSRRWVWVAKSTRRNSRLRRHGRCPGKRPRRGGEPEAAVCADDRYRRTGPHPRLDADRRRPGTAASPSPGSTTSCTAGSTAFPWTRGEHRHGAWPACTHDGPRGLKKDGYCRLR